MFSPVVEWRKDEHVTSFTRVMQKLAARAGYAESNTNPEEAAENGQEGKARVLVFIKGRGASNVVSGCWERHRMFVAHSACSRKRCCEWCSLHLARWRSGQQEPKSSRRGRRPLASAP